MQSTRMGRNNADFRGENNPRYRHGLTDGKKYRHPVYVAWQNMKARCLNPNNEKYPRYGGRGITICAEWMDVVNFAKWAFLNGWSEGLTIDRKENDGNYEPDNCRWTTKSKNSQKKSTTKLTYQLAQEIRAKYNGSDMQSLASEYDVSTGTIWFIVNNDIWNESFD